MRRQRYCTGTRAVRRYFCIITDPVPSLAGHHGGEVQGTCESHDRGRRELPPTAAGRGENSQRGDGQLTTDGRLDLDKQHGDVSLTDPRRFDAVVRLLSSETHHTRTRVPRVITRETYFPGSTFESSFEPLAWLCVARTPLPSRSVFYLKYIKSTINYIFYINTFLDDVE